MLKLKHATQFHTYFLTVLHRRQTKSLWWATEARGTSSRSPPFSHGLCWRRKNVGIPGCGGGGGLFTAPDGRHEGNGSIFACRLLLSSCLLILAGHHFPGASYSNLKQNSWTYNFVAKFLGHIILRVLRHEVSLYNVYITNQFQTIFARGGGGEVKSVSEGDCMWIAGRKTLLRLFRLFS